MFVLKIPLHTLTVLGALLCSTASMAAEVTPAETSPHYFYRAQDYGSESLFNPLAVLVNGGFDILRNPSYSSDLLRLNFSGGLKNLGRNLAAPQKAITDGGIERLISHEVFPIHGLDPAHGQWMPNYVLHTVGEGMLLRKTEDWYSHQGFGKLPAFVLGLSTVLSMQILNEVTENGSYSGTNADPVMDIYIFNALGYLLYAFDDVARFFSGPAKILYWPGQPAMDLSSGRLLNAGENFAFKFELPWTDARLFTYLGVGFMMGLSIPLQAKDHISVAGGTRLLELQVSPTPGSRILVPKGNLNGAFGVFWDRDESLMAALIIEGPTRPNVQLNVYPGVIDIDDDQRFGFYVSASRFDGFSAGFTVRGLPVTLGLSMLRDSSAERF